LSFDRPLIPLYIGNIEEIGGVLKEVKWAPVARELENYGKHIEDEILGNPPFIPTFPKIDQSMEEFMNWILTKLMVRKIT
jgi:hypothetical protein